MQKRRSVVCGDGKQGQPSRPAAAAATTVIARMAGAAARALIAALTEVDGFYFLFILVAFLVGLALVTRGCAGSAEHSAVAAIDWLLEPLPDAK
jgi:hypothetical protein